LDGVGAEPEPHRAVMVGAERRPRRGWAAPFPPAGAVLLFEASPTAAGGDVGHAVLRIAPLVIVTVAVEIELVLAVRQTELVEVSGERRRAGMVPRRICRPVAERHDERNTVVSLGEIHQ